MLRQVSRSEAFLLIIPPVVIQEPEVQEFTPDTEITLAPGGWSQAIVTLPNLNTTYYFSCTAYSSCSVGDILGNTMNASCKTSGNIDKTITFSQNYTVPAGYNYVDIFCVGGGGGGRGGWMDRTNYQYAGGGGGGGYTSTASNVSVSADRC